MSFVGGRHPPGKVEMNDTTAQSTEAVELSYEADRALHVLNSKTDAITLVYSGRSGCACGCRGNYSDTRRSITIVANKLRKALLADDFDTVMIDDAFVSVDLASGRNLTVYFDADVMVSSGQTAADAVAR